jgi:peptidoglycan/xylan/chitin deacetylase (PgdA/CDA1 family)
MNARTERTLDTVLRRSPAQPLFEWRAANRLAVLAYHDIEDAGMFERHLDALLTRAVVVSIDDVTESMSGGRSLPKRSVLITFDDGHRSTVDVALPLLVRRRLPAVAFVVAGLIDTEQPFWWSEVVELIGRGGTVSGLERDSAREVVRFLKRVPDDRRRAVIQGLVDQVGPASPMAQLRSDELRRLEANGISVGNHTWSHPCLSRCSDDATAWEVGRAHERLSAILGHDPVAFAYPDGDADVRAVPHLRTMGYRAAFLFDHRLGSPSGSAWHSISRLRVNSTTSVDRLLTIVSGLHPAVHHARGGA